MQSDWECLTLAQAGVRLIDCDHRTPPAANSGYPYVAIPQLKDGHIELDGVRRISHEHYVEWTKKLRPLEHDVIVVRRCNSGVSAVVSKGLECAIGQNLVVLRSDGARVIPEFLRWLVRGDEWWEQVRKFVNVGAVFDSLKCRDIPNFQVLVPPIAEQIRITAILSALDDRIDLLRQTNATLEAIAQALFKSWFIDFDPVRAKAEGREPEGMDAATAALFPNEFEESELGKIPKGWRAVTVAEAVEFNPSYSLTRGTEVRYLEMANTPTSGHRPVGRISLRAFGSGCKFCNGDALLAKITPCLENGKSAFVDFLNDGEVGWGSTEFIVLRAKPVLPQYGAYLLARHEPFRQFAIQAMTGTSGRQRVVLSRLAQFPMALPPDTFVAQAAEPTLRALQSRIAANDEQAKVLTGLRDALLPRLISGKLRLPRAPEQLSEALG
jgi:type I restriction enzyme S subunit